MIKRWKSSFITLEPFNVDTLVEELGVEIDYESFRLWDNLFWGTCDVDYHVVMHFLGKLHFFNSNTTLMNFGSTLRQLVDYGDLQIIPRTTAPVPKDDGTWVRFYFFKRSGQTRALLHFTNVVVSHYATFDNKCPFPEFFLLFPSFYPHI